MGGPDTEDNGKFAWILDPEGRKIELWEPVESARDPYVAKVTPNAVGDTMGGDTGSPEW